MQESNKKPVILITGSSGLIGTAVAENLSNDFETVGLDAKFPDVATKIGDFIECDLTSDDSVQLALDTVKQRHGNRLTSVIHLAAYYDFAGEPSEMYDKLTVQGTIRLLKKLQEFETEQFVFSSTILVMEPADEEGEVLTESSPLEDEPWDYPKSKIETENLIRKERGQIKTVILRIGGVYNEDTHTVPVAQQIARIYEKQFESYFYPGDASHGQAFVHLEDLVDGIRKVVERREELPETDVFIIAEPDLMSYKELQDEIGQLIHGEEWTTVWIPKFMAKAGAWAQENILGKETFIKPWMVDLADDHFPVSIKHARETLGWNPQNTLRDTLPKMVGKLKQDPQKWYEVNGLELPDESEGKKEKSKKAG